MVSVTIVTWNSAQYLKECFAALARQDYRDLEIIIVDNASEDGTHALLQPVEPKWRVIYNDKNVGFAAGQNQAIRASRGDWVLCLNPDVVLSPDFVTQLVGAGEAHPDAGALCGKLLRWNPGNTVLYQGTTSVVPNGPAKDEDFSPCTEPAQGLKPAFSTADAARLKPCPDTKLGDDAGRTLIADASQTHAPRQQTNLPDPHETNIIDSTGIYFTPNMRHLDRGAEEIDRGQYDRVQYVFGASGAAAFFRRDFIEAVSVEGEFFDEEFFAFREDGDLAWRAQLMGWKCLYVPMAIAWHVRRVTPERRKDLPLVINWHSAKNRFLMRGKNASGWLCWRLFFPVLARDIMTFGYAIVRDRRLWSAVTYWWKARDSIRRKRAIIQSRRRVSDRDLLWWFSNTPCAIDAEKAVASWDSRGDRGPSTPARN
ncbi:MAG: glycosyltransferase [Candidatus Korobacteraceae bacterium]|jgi:GT2 family glycosyltransferase